MTLLTLILDNFKGTRHFELLPNGESCVVRGANGVGKSTLMDAYWWLLTGKNSAGETDFDIYPIHCAEGVEVSVEGRFKCGDDVFFLRRVFRKKVERRRGDAEAKLRGNTTDYYIDEVPKPLKDYSAFVMEHFGDERRLHILSKLHYFALDLHWADRRGALLDLFAPHLDDKDIIHAHKELAPLDNWVSVTRTVEDCALQAKAERKKIRARLDEIPPRIDEADKSRPELPPEASAERLPALAKQKQKLNIDIAALESGESASALRRQIADKQTKAAEAKTLYITDTMGGSKNLELQCGVLREKIADANARLDDHRREGAAEERVIEGLTKEIAELRREVVEVHNAVFDGSTACPTCGRDYPPEQMDTVRAAWNTQKSEREESITLNGRELTETLQMIRENHERRIGSIKELEGKLETYKAHLQQLTDSIKTPPAWETTTDAKACAVEISELEASLAQLDAATGKRLADLRAQMAEIVAQIEAVTGRAEVQKQIDRTEARIKELKAEEKKLGAELAVVEERLRLTELFVQLQARDIEDAVNCAFTRVQWRLFEEQINGGIAPCCEATVDGVAYKNINTAGQCNAGLDIINVLSDKFGARLPVWIDRAESVTAFYRIPNQTILLAVDADSEELSMEVLQ